MAVWPISNLARRDYGAGVFFARGCDRNFEIDLLAPGQRRCRDRQRRCDGLGSRRVEQLGVKCKRAKVEADKHNETPGLISQRQEYMPTIGIEISLPGILADG